MKMLALAFASVLPVIPSERHIDCSGWNGVAQLEFKVRVTTLDGRNYKSGVELLPNSTAEQARDLLWVALDGNELSGHTVGKEIIVLQGSKKSRIRSVEFESKGWKPTVRYVLVAPEKK
jgi:hypothetical protein